MKRFNKVLVLCTVGMLAFALSCGHPTTLTSITISPSSYTVTGAGAALATLPVQYTAYGHFIHPTETVDITSSPNLTWTSSVTTIATIQSYPDATPGQAVATGNGSCGLVTITATANKGLIGPGSANAIVYAQATFDVQDTNNVSCP